MSPAEEHQFITVSDPRKSRRTNSPNSLKMYQVVFLFALFGAACAGYQQEAVAVAQPAYAAPAVAAYAAPAYAAPAYAAPAYAPAPVYAAAPAAVAPVLKSSGPQQYSQQIPAAAIRNVETVGVTKTITPVVTKTTTYNSHSEPALSVGHVQGYSQHAHGPAKHAPVTYTTQYTQYLNPTVGANGPVTYAGPALSQGVAVQQGAVAVGVGAQPVAYAAQGYAGHGYAGHGAAIAAPAYAAPAPAFLNAGHGYAGHGAAVAAPAFLNAGYQNFGGYAGGAHGAISAYDTGSLLQASGYSGSLGGHFRK